MFQKDAQIITPEAIENVKAALASSEVQQKADVKKRAIPCKAAGQAWEDPTLADWPEGMILNPSFHLIYLFKSDYNACLSLFCCSSRNDGFTQAFRLVMLAIKIKWNCSFINDF